MRCVRRADGSSRVAAARRPLPVLTEGRVSFFSFDGSEAGKPVVRVGGPAGEPRLSLNGQFCGTGEVPLSGPWA